MLYFDSLANPGLTAGDCACCSDSKFRKRSLRRFTDAWWLISVEEREHEIAYNVDGARAARAAFLTERVHLDLVLANPTLEFAVHSSFGEDTRGRLYVVSLRGEIYRLTETRPAHQLSDFLRLAAFQ